MIKIRAIQALRPNQEFTIINDDLSTIIWNSPNITTPTELEVNAKIEELKINDAQIVISKAEALESAKSKLKALGLTEEEAKALAGI